MSADRIAVVGLACRYPDATNPTQLWQNVLAKRRAFRHLPDTRLGPGYRDEHAPDATYLTRAAVLRDWTFDRERFGVPGPLYRAADHTHWLALETAAAALADAGAPGADGLDRETTGVVLGNSLTGEFSRAGLLRLRWPFLADATATALHDAGLSDDVTTDVLERLQTLVKEPFPAPGDETLSGALANTIAGRVCNYFDFHGTGYTVDGACSSSLLAVAAACRALVAGECDFMLAGGVDLSLDPLELVGFSRLGALATGDMRVYDADPTGFLPGEGCGVVALMRAFDAEKRGLRTYAHIIGWASSSDGSGGLTRPELSGQAMALHRAYRAAAIAPGQARLVEGHGTGTAIGDRVELAALSAVRGGDAPPAALGSIKANIGHTKAAAGAASLIKATLAAHHRLLPPTTGCAHPHDLLRDAPLRVLAEAEPWPDETPRAGVSAMGFGGINVHVVLENPAPHSAVSTPARSANAAWSAPRDRHEIVPLAADTPDALAEQLSALADAATALSVAEVGDIAATAWHSGDGEGRYRAMLVAATPDELASAATAAVSRLAAWGGALAFDRHAGYALGSEPVRVGLLFPGQAAPARAELPWWARGLGVPTGAESALDTAAAVGLDSTSAAATEVAQPAIVRQSLAALAWLDAIGCEAIGACGHSLGEITGLHWAGACTASTALDLAVSRGRLMAEHAVDETTMAGLATSATTAEDLISGTDAVIACHNAPRRIVVAGPVDDVEGVLDRAHAGSIAASRLPVSHGFHSPAMRPVAGPLRAALADIAVDTVRGDRPLFSTVTGGLLSDGDLRRLLVDQLTKPVRFADAVAALAARCELLLETGPGTMLTDLVAANDLDVPALSVDSGGDPRTHAFATAVLAAAGNGTLGRWFSDRPYRTLDWRDTPHFLVNPCETPHRRATPARSTSGVMATSGRFASGTGHQGEGAGSPASSAQHHVRDTGPSVGSAGYGDLGTQHSVGSDGHGPLEALTQHLAAVLELPEQAIAPSMSLLRDLHMTSIQVVNAVGAVATRLDRQPPVTPLSLSDATVAEAAEILAELPSATNIERPAAPAGVRGWVRQFEHTWLPFDTHTSTAAAAGTLTVTLPCNASPADVAALLAEVSAQQPRCFRVVHTGHPAAQGVGRSIAAELPDCQVVVLEREDTTDPGEAGLGHPDRYLELRTQPDGTVERAALRARPPQPRQHTDGDTPVPGGVCLVTGGIRGITAYAAAELAASASTTLVFLGRTPADDPDITAALRDLTDSGHPDVHYVACDVTEPTSVQRMLTEARTHGTITGVIHGAGINEPRALDEITAESFAATLAPKVDGLRTLLDALGDATDDVRLLLGFGSIIGRRGLAGQAAYCIANDWLRADIEAWARAHPQCRTHLLEWSVWSGVGMGVRLGVLDHLRRQGVEPIGTREGVDALRDVLADPQAPVTVLITARFPDTATMHLAAESAPLLRFGEHLRARVPGVEAVTEAELSLGSDPYLDDHRIEGSPVLPAVVAMEAMAQTASHVDPISLPISLSHLEFHAPITLGDPGPRTIQVAALSDAHGTDVVIRDDSDTTNLDRFSGTLVTAPEPPAPEPPSQQPPPTSDVGPDECYDTTFFHTGRFRRLLRFELLSAFRVRAWIRAEQGNDAVPWFSPFHSGRLLLGDPGAHDATLHALLACVPHRVALPVGVDRVTVWREPTGVLRVDAVETSHTHDDYVFDVILSEPDGTVVARWQGLRLHATTPPQRKDTLPVRLVGPWLTRRLVECGLHHHVELLTAPGRRTFGAATGLLQQLTGASAGHDLAGAPHVNGSHASASYAHNTLLLGVADDPVGLDWESVPATPAHAGAVPCDAADHPVTELLADKLGEDPTLARLRVWTAREALSKLGYGQSEPLRIDRITEDGLTILRAGAEQVVTAKVHTTDPRGAQVKVAAVACPKEPNT